LSWSICTPHGAAFKGFLKINDMRMLSTYILNLSIFFISFIFLLLTIAFTTLPERKVMGSMQRRRGPNVAGFFGFLQPIADGLKLFLKEIITPTNASTFIFFLAPVFTLFTSIILWLVIPFNKNTVLIDIPHSMLSLLAISSFAVYGIIFSGWASNSKYAFLGGLRSAAQMISYEVGIAFIWLSICTIADSLNISDVVSRQEDSTWFIFPLAPLAILFFIIALAETNRAPFDLPEAEAELVAGYNVEYSAIAFALFFLGEYANMALMSSVFTIFFLGGWLAPFGLTFVSPFLWFGMKVTACLVLFIWVRATLPRYRYDQLLGIGWKRLLPLVLSGLIITVMMKMLAPLLVSQCIECLPRLIERLIEILVLIRERLIEILVLIREEIFELTPLVLIFFICDVISDRTKIRLVFPRNPYKYYYL
jgi:NADH-quinone oxidoreductase subunit H